MKKRILFVAGSLRVGGIERSLVNLLKCLDYTVYDVDLFLYSNSGEYINELPKNVRLVNKSFILNCVGLTMQEAKRSKKISIILLRIVLALFCRIFGSVRVFRFLFAMLPTYKDYDTAISFSNNVNEKSLYFGFNQFVLTKVHANKKIAWIHSDYIKAGLDRKINNNEYRRFDAIVNVSFAGKKSFDKTLPELEKKSYVVYNAYPIQQIIQQASITNPYNDSLEDKIVTVGRIDENKSVDRIVKICSRLNKVGLNFNWYIVGDGEERAHLEKMSKELGVWDQIHFIGTQKNPYPYIYNSNLFVLASKYEGMPMVVSESLILGVPVIVTRYESAEEQICNNYNGIIVSNNEDELFNVLKDVLKDHSIVERMKNNLTNIKYSNDMAIYQFNKLMDG